MVCMIIGAGAESLESDSKCAVAGALVYRLMTGALVFGAIL